MIVSTNDTKWFIDPKDSGRLVPAYHAVVQASIVVEILLTDPLSSPVSCQYYPEIETVLREEKTLILDEL